MPRERTSEAAARTVDAGLTPCPSPTLNPLLKEHAPSVPAEADLPKSESKPGRMSSLRLSLVSFVSRLFGTGRKKLHRQTHSNTREDDQKEIERLDRYAARRALLPLSLPNQLILCKGMIHHPNDHYIKIIENCSNIPMLVGDRKSSHSRSKFRRVRLCLGGRWYATWTEPFLNARVQNHEIMVKICDHQLATAPETTVVKAWQKPEDKHSWYFEVGIPGPIDRTITVQEDFEWHARQRFRLEGEKKYRHGSYLIQVSAGKVVAILERRLTRKGSSVVSLSFTITFLGSGQQYGGLWKIIVFAIGLCGY